MEVHLNVTDMMNDTDAQANQTMRKTFKVENLDGLRDSEIILNGYDIQVKCADNEQYVDDTIWPLHFQMEVSKVVLPDDDPEPGSFLYAVSVIIDRGQIPKSSVCEHTHYEVTVPLKVFFFNKDVGAAVNREIYWSEGDITDKQGQYSVHVAKFNKSFPAQSAIVGLHNIGFMLEWDRANKNRGRYIGQFEFFIKTVSFSTIAKQAYVGFQRGLLSPGLFPSSEKVQYTFGITTIAVAGPSQPKVGTVRNTQGQICIDDWKSLFWCSSEGMAEKTSDFVSIEVGGDDFEHLVTDAVAPVEHFRGSQKSTPAFTFLQ